MCGVCGRRDERVWEVSVEKCGGGVGKCVGGDGMCGKCGVGEGNSVGGK